MSTNSFTESVVEEAALAWLESLGYTILSGPDVAPGDAPACCVRHLRPWTEGKAPLRINCLSVAAGMPGRRHSAP